MVIQKELAFNFAITGWTKVTITKIDGNLTKFTTNFQRFKQNFPEKKCQIFVSGPEKEVLINTHLHYLQFAHTLLHSNYASASNTKSRIIPATQIVK